MRPLYESLKDPELFDPASIELHVPPQQAMWHVPAPRRHRVAIGPFSPLNWWLCGRNFYAVRVVR